jgi:hypothetical protein
MPTALFGPERPLLPRFLAGALVILIAGSGVGLVGLWYSWYITPVSIGDAKYDDKRALTVLSITGVVGQGENGSDGDYYRVSDGQADMLVRADPSSTLPRAGQSVWVLGYVALGNRGERGLIEYWRR